MTVELHRDDLPPGAHFGHAVAIDTETLGLNPYRDRLCLVQLSAATAMPSSFSSAGITRRPS